MRFDKCVHRHPPSQQGSSIVLIKVASPGANVGASFCPFRPTPPCQRVCLLEECGAAEASSGSHPRVLDIRGSSAFTVSAGQQQQQHVCLCAGLVVLLGSGLSGPRSQMFCFSPCTIFAQSGMQLMAPSAREVVPRVAQQNKDLTCLLVVTASHPRPDMTLIVSFRPTWVIAVCCSH